MHFFQRQTASLVALISVIMLIVAASAVAARDTKITEILEHDPYLESLDRMRDDFRTIVGVDFGFSEEDTDAWSAAIDKAFDPDTLRADYSAALVQQLTDPVLSSAYDYFTSDLRVERDRVTRQLLDLDINDATVRAGIKAEIEATPRVVSRQAEHLFYEYRSHEAARSVIELYFKAMIIAAEPAVGGEEARAWVAALRHAQMVDIFEESTFLVFSATFSRYPEKSREAFIELVSSPDMIEYERGAHKAFEQAFTKAVERIKEYYP